MSARPGRVLMTADAVGGVWTYALELARALHPHGVEVLLATMGGDLSPDQARAAAAVPGLHVVDSPYRLEWMQEPWEDVAQAGNWLLALALQFRPHLVHLNGYAHASLPWSAPKLVVSHSCVLSWWEAVKGEPAPASWDRYRQAVRTGLEAANAVAAPTQAMAESLARHYGLSRPVTVVPNGRGATRVPSGPKQAFVLTAGRLWDEAKNVSTLAMAAAGLEWPIYAAGELQHPDGGAFDPRPLRGLGTLSADELRTWYARAAVYALPARYEPFGLSALEAAASGCALVLGDIPSLREVWGEAALYVDPVDADAWRRALQGLIDRPHVRTALAEAAQARAARYTPERMAAGYLNLYQAVLKPESLGASV